MYLCLHVVAQQQCKECLICSGPVLELSVFHIVSGILEKGNLLPGILNIQVLLNYTFHKTKSWEIHAINALIQVLPMCAEEQLGRNKPW